MPWYGLHGGRDHFWVLAHDIGSCMAPLSMQSSIFIQTNSDPPGLHDPENLLHYVKKSTPLEPSDGVSGFEYGPIQHLLTSLTTDPLPRHCHIAPLNR
jgi:hypothetical protein